VLVIGSGAREHAIAHTLTRSSREPRLLAYPGNPGILELARPLLPSSDSPADIVAATREAGVDLVVIGPEVFLAAGLADACLSAGLRVFGPTRDAARIETSKSWAKEVMAAADVPTAAYRRVIDPEAARACIEAQAGGIVVKADGIAAGKGVLVTHDTREAAEFADAYLSSGSAVVVEELLQGPEISLFALVSGEDVLPLGCARDYKRACDGDEGPNTGGMGAISPPDVPATFLEDMTDRLVRPVARELAHRGSPFHGVLYAGLILTPRGPSVLEFNARFGDPEAQVLLPRLETDLLDLLDAVAARRLSGTSVELSPRHACGVAIAGAGYPHPAEGAARRFPVRVGEMPEDTILFHAGSSPLPGSAFGFAAGGSGRMFTAVGLGETAERARARAYALARVVEFEGAWYRTDIGA
jgi:phosphoribosylamine--glycine ligase